jgi:CheY-like chemotaxis protein
MAPTILLVDDDALMHGLFKHHLDRAGFRMISATNGSDAIVTAEREHPQLIIMDIMMPKLDGLSALRQLKRAEATKDIQVIVVTANVGAHNLSRKEAETAGAAAFLTKPLSPAQLMAEVKRLVPLPPAVPAHKPPDK